MSEDREEHPVSGVISLLDDIYATKILLETSSEPLSPLELADRFDVTAPTVYDRIERLREYELLQVEPKLHPKGHHYRRYRVNFEQVKVKLENGGFKIEVSRTEAPVERFTRLYEGFQ